jgi:hypothetical protein
MNVEAYLEFLRFALTDNSAVPNSVANINWQGLLRFAKEQAVVGIYARRILFINDKLNECNWLGNKPNECVCGSRGLGFITLFGDGNII